VDLQSTLGGSDSRHTEPRIAVLGGGQLAQMMWQEADAVPAYCRPISLQGEEACRSIPATATIAAFATEEILRAAAGCDVLTFDHEVVAPELLDEIGAALRLAPSASQMRFSHKDEQREQFRQAGLPVPEFRVVRDRAGLDSWMQLHPAPWLLKAAFGGYDGRGVIEFSDPAVGYEYLAGCGVAVAEELLSLTAEAAVLTARSPRGGLVNWPVVDTLQVEGMCREVTYPSSLPPNVQARMVELAREIAERVEAQGVLAVEFFVVGEQVLINELAPRPHNSGHLTIEASATSQFVNHLRGVSGLALGDTTMTAPAAAMVNLVGSQAPSDHAANAPRPPEVLSFGESVVHWYGKASKPGRKLGHVTNCAADLATAIGRAREDAARFGEEIGL
jgi:5-(carboxyamino)imidazole ribonucleotide synthase